MGFDLTNTSGELVEYTGDIPPGHSADCYGNGPFIGVVSCFFELPEGKPCVRGAHGLPCCF